MRADQFIENVIDHLLIGFDYYERKSKIIFTRDKHVGLVIHWVKIEHF